MTRIGWTLLALFALGIAALAAMTRVSGAGEGVSWSPPTASSQRSPVARASRPAPLHAVMTEQAVAAPIGDTLAASALPMLTVPVAGVARASITDTWGQARSEGRVHHGTDIVAPRGTAVLAAAPGVVEKLFQSARGGTTVYERAIDRRWTFYYAHLAGYAPGLHEGQAVKARELLGFVGDTGDAGAGNYHLHFGLARTTPDQHWYQGDDVNAYPALVSSR